MFFLLSDALTIHSLSPAFSSNLVSVLHLKQSIEWIVGIILDLHIVFRPGPFLSVAEFDLHFLTRLTLEQLTLSMLHIFFEFAIKLVTVCKDFGSTAIHLAFFKIAIINSTIIIGQHSFSVGYIIYKLTFIERISFRLIKFTKSMKFIIFEFTLVQVTIIKLKLPRSLFLALNKLAGINYCVLFSSFDPTPMIQIVLPFTLIERSDLTQVNALSVGFPVFEFTLVHVPVLHREPAFSMEYTFLGLSLIEGPISILNFT